ncbi:hypothetical protein N7470_002947 [Penicillium chermesinum]|nr:hypothetical protein N7470_002947 [Penicillium chermesinum]
MAPDKKEKKRKSTVASDSPAKKTKKVEPKTGDLENIAPNSVKASNGSVHKSKPRKRAADFLSDDENEEPAASTSTKSAKKPKKSESAGKESKTSSKAKKTEEVAEDSDDEPQDVAPESEDEEDEELDDQTAALIKGFESSGDEDDSGDEGYSKDKPVPKIPDSKKTQRKIAKKLKQNEAPEEPGTVYIGRIPHGFYEHQMRAYFSQFGDITRLRLSRNRITGRSKHYAFVEFSSATVAKIVAETMDNYLMYGHILKCKFVPQEQLHAEVWKGANRRFKRTPWNRIEKKRLEKGKTREQWSKRIEEEQKKRQATAEKMKALGYDVPLPQLKSVDDVPVQVQESKAVEAATTPAEEPTKAIEAPADEETPKSKKSKKIDTPKEKAVEAATDSPATKSKKKAKKAKA